MARYANFTELPRNFSVARIDSNEDAQIWKLRKLLSKPNSSFQLFVRNECCFAWDFH